MKGPNKRDALVVALGRIQELEHMISALTQKIEVVERKNSDLLKLLATFELSSKDDSQLSTLSSYGELNRDLISGIDQDSNMMKCLRPNNIFETGVEEKTGNVLENTPKSTDFLTVQPDNTSATSDVKEANVLEITATSMDFLTVQPDNVPATSDVPTDTCGGLQMGSASHEIDCVIPVERGTTVSQFEQVSKRGKKAGRIIQNQPTRHIALKIMYLGSSYHGFASQGVSQKTVESELFAALEHTKLMIGNRIEANYSRCGRTDKGVSAIGQVISLQLRSKNKRPVQGSGSELLSRLECGTGDLVNESTERLSIDRVSAARASRSLEEYVSTQIGTGTDDEIDYVGVLNRVLPVDIRVLGWCPVPPDFNARFSCLYREYKYFFVNSDFDINAMKEACSKFLGDHDFRNFCKMDAANVHNYRRTISSFEIFPVNESCTGKQVWVMRVRGTAFLWHQIRCMAAVLFMVGKGYESPVIVEDLLDVGKVGRKPQYPMASELPLLLHTCGFQGLTLHCTSRAAVHLQRHLHNLMEQTLMQLTLIQEALLELPCSGPLDLEKYSFLKKHVPLLLRLTEPSYEERHMRSGGRAWV